MIYPEIQFDSTWQEVETGIIRAPEMVKRQRVVKALAGFVELEDGKAYLCNFPVVVGQLVKAHIPLDDIGYVTYE